MANLEILLDYDGVVGDFVTAANIAAGMPADTVPTNWDWYKDYGITSADFWSRVNDCGDSFYEEMVKWYPWTDELLGIAREYGPLTIVSRSQKHGSGWSGKFNAITRYIPDARVIIVSDDVKSLLAAPNRVLIDDSDPNCHGFAAAGGKAILFPQPWNENKSFTGNRVDFVEHLLDFYSEELAYDQNPIGPGTVGTVLDLL